MGWGEVELVEARQVVQSCISPLGHYFLKLDTPWGREEGTSSSRNRT